MFSSSEADKYHIRSYKKGTEERNQGLCIEQFAYSVED